MVLIGGDLILLQNTFCLVLLGRCQRMQCGVGQLAGTTITVAGVLGHASGDHPRPMPAATCPGLSWLGRGAGSIKCEATNRSTLSPRNGGAPDKTFAEKRRPGSRCRTDR